MSCVHSFNLIVVALIENRKFIFEEEKSFLEELH